MIVFIGDHSITKVLLLQPVCYLSVSAYLLTIYAINVSECVPFHWEIIFVY